MNHYTVYRHDDPGFTPQGTDSIAGTAEVFYVDTASAAGDTAVDYFYIIRAVDADGRRSADSNRVGEFDRALANTEK